MKRFKEPLCFLLAIVFITSMTVACTARERAPDTEGAGHVQPGFDLVGECEVIAQLKGNSLYYVMRFSGTDALYLVSSKWSNTVPFLDADGTPVTYDEFMERMEDAE